MAEPTVWELTVPEVTVEDILRSEGVDYRKHPPRPGMVDLHRRILAEASALVQPKAIWTEVEVTGAGDKELCLQDGLKLTSRLLAKMAGSAEKLILFAMTIGSAIEEQISSYQRAEKMSRAFALDAAGSTMIAMGSSLALSRIEEIYHREGLKTTFPMGPGHSYWKGLDDQQIIFYYLQPERIGLHLNDSNLIIPRKSVSMVLGVGHNLPELNGRTHCDFCTLRRNCHMTKVVASV